MLPVLPADHHDQAASALINPGSALDFITLSLNVAERSYSMYHKSNQNINVCRLIVEMILMNFYKAHLISNLYVSVSLSLGRFALHVASLSYSVSLTNNRDTC